MKQNNGNLRPNVPAILNGLKDFQRDTVDYVFRRLYTDPEPTRRFLIADEVGLGKTLVARGVIARAIDHMWDHIDRIDVVYICSNGDIARQNINRLNVTGQDDFALASRITLLPTVLHNLKEKKVNFISFTPGTSFDLKSRLGTSEERVLLYRLLGQNWSLSGTGPLNVLQGGKNKDNFRWEVKRHQKEMTIDPAIAETFAQTLMHRMQVEQKEGKQTLQKRFIDLCSEFAHARKYIPEDESRERAAVIGELRALLAAACLKALEPDLIILDEFQRFKHLLEDGTEESCLAQELFNYGDEHAKARVLLLSATPYKMYTLNHEAQEENHYVDFIRTQRFLLEDSVQADELEQLLEAYRRELHQLGNGGISRLVELKNRIESILRRVMVRTERLAATADRNGMLKQMACPGMVLAPEDLATYTTMSRIARHLDHGSVLEYWKTAPYLLNFMDSYKLKSNFLDAIENDGTELAAEIKENDGLLLSASDIQRYGKIDPGNARLRSLIAQTLDTGAWRLLWLPPAMPYYQLGGPFAEPGLANFTKRLVFSSWRVAPKIIATLLSYDAERRMICSHEDEPANTKEGRDRRRPLLRFIRTQGRLTGMPVLALIYPSLVLAHVGDPLEIMKKAESARSLTAEAVLEIIARRIVPLLEDLPVKTSETGPRDETWYWLAPFLLDAMADRNKAIEWMNRDDLQTIWAGETPAEAEAAEDDGTDDITGFTSHIRYALEQVREALAGHLTLGPQPTDLAHVLAQLALAGPGVTALRALWRVATVSESGPDAAIRDHAAPLAHSFLSLFNLPEAMALIRGMNGEEPYWRRVLEYCVIGGLQAVLDEYTHVLRESLGLIARPPLETARSISHAISEALTLRTANLDVDHFCIDTDGKTVRRGETQGMRARFALRFGEERGEDSKRANRADQVRTAFNSPFWPFVLASTSVGQEGLDFHTYCHAIVHWNLPSNPVDMEQREGRVHRYKGHAIRKNLARAYLSELDEKKILMNGSHDPWASVFEFGRQGRQPGETDMVPFWIYCLQGGAQIQRYVPALPLSREEARGVALSRSQTLYRLAFGQSRQEDLLNYLLGRLPEEEIARIVETLQIDLRPPTQLT